MESEKYPKILLKNKLVPEAIQVISDQVSNRRTTPELEIVIESNWQSKLTEAAERNRILYNGKTYRLNGFTSDADGVSLELSTVDYKNFIGLRGYPDLRIMGEEYFPKPIYVASLIRTSDGEYVFAELSGRTMEDVQYDFIGGVLSRDEIEVHTGQDIFSALVREIQEEASVPAPWISRSMFSGITLDEGYNVGLHYFTDLNVSAQEVQTVFDAGHDHELKGLVFVPETSVVNFLRSLGHEYALAVTLNDLEGN